MTFHLEGHLLICANTDEYLASGEESHKTFPIVCGNPRCFFAGLLAIQRGKVLSLFGLDFVVDALRAYNSRRAC
jgi:hypothetical protein